MPARRGAALRASRGVSGGRTRRCPHVRQAISAVDQDSESSPLGCGGSAAGGDHDVARHEALQQEPRAPLDVRHFDRYADDAPSLNPGPVEPPLDQRFERRRPALPRRRRLEAQDVHLPVALLPNQKAAGSVQPGCSVRAQEHLGQDVHQAARRANQRARRFAIRRSRKNRTTR